MLANSSGSRINTSRVFVRYSSGRNIKYPRATTGISGIKNALPKSHKSRLRSMMDQFLGPKNYKGEYYMNKYYEPATGHQTNYIRRSDTIDEGGYLKNEMESSIVQPFVLNDHCTTNSIVSKELKDKIFKQLEKEGVTVQDVAFRFDMHVARIEALVTLKKVEDKWLEDHKISPALETMSEAMYNMFPLFREGRDADNLTEIPIPGKTLNSRFLTIAESEPFGPIDAAESLGLEPATVTLERLSKGHLQSKEHATRKVGFIAPILKHEKSAFRFKHAKVGEVGIRYGKSNRDNKKNRGIGHNEIGQRVYI